jgi:hypothetical protein
MPSKRSWKIFATSLLLLFLWVSEGACAQAPSSTRRFIWIGNLNRQFTEEQYKYIVENHSIVVLAKFHDGWSIQKQHEAAAELKRRNPNIKVFPYFSASYWWPIKPYAMTYGQRVFKEKWYLHDLNDDWTLAANPIDHRIEYFINGILGFYVDSYDVNYRLWAFSTISNWMNKIAYGVPIYNGIAFDAATIYNIYYENGETPPPGVKRMLDSLGGNQADAKAKLTKLNIGRKQLVRGAKLRLGNKMVIFNGIAESTSLYNRSLALFNYADAALYEDFCYNDNTHKFYTKEKILRDIDLILGDGGKYSGKIFLLKTNVLNYETLTLYRRKKIRRFSYAAFLLGYRPGYTFYKYGEYPLYDVKGEVGFDPAEIEIDFGDPLGQYHPEGSVYARNFEKGLVYVNMEGTPQTVVLPETLILMNGGVPGRTFNPGGNAEIPAMDAAFFLRP